MRFETHRVSEYFVRLLQYAPPVDKVLVDGGDIIECALTSGERISLHLIESDIALYEAEQILRDNGKRGLHSLFFFWRDLLLPGDGDYFALDGWLAAWLELYGGKVYAYELSGSEVYLFPVFVESSGAGWTARFGETIDPTRLVTREVRTSGLLSGFWRVAAFDGDSDRPTAWVPRTIDEFYAVLELERGASKALVKRAYRRLARRLHPDINTASDANAQMQVLNDAYRALLEHLDGEGGGT